MFFWPLGIPGEKAYSYFIINDEHWAFTVIWVERFPNTATKPFFKKKISILKKFILKFGMYKRPRLEGHKVK